MPVNRILLAAQLLGMFVVFALVLFLAAGTVAWLAGWAFLILFFGFTVLRSQPCSSHRITRILISSHCAVA